jgi:dolichyl-phosphate-mannose--protein O-mannosyl transferase
MDLWNRDVGFLVSLIVLAALLVVLHVWVWLRTLRAPRVPGLLRWFSWLPLVGPVIGLVVGPRVASVLWFIVLAAYLVLRRLA